MLTCPTSISEPSTGTNRLVDPDFFRYRFPILSHGSKRQVVVACVFPLNIIKCDFAARSRGVRCVRVSLCKIDQHYELPSCLGCFSLRDAGEPGCILLFRRPHLSRLVAPVCNSPLHHHTGFRIHPLARSRSTAFTIAAASRSVHHTSDTITILCSCHHLQPLLRGTGACSSAPFALDSAPCIHLSRVFVSCSHPQSKH